MEKAKSDLPDYLPRPKMANKPDIVIKLPSSSTVKWDKDVLPKKLAYRLFLEKLTHEVCRATGATLATIRQVIPTITTSASLVLIIVSEAKFIKAYQTTNLTLN